MTDSIFTKIIKGEVPCHKIYEDDLTLAFLDIHPVQPGHTLVIPKKQIAHVWDLLDEDYLALWQTAKKVAARLREVLPEKTHIAAQVEGLDVAHAHVKLFPFNNAREFRRTPDMAVEPDHPALAELAKKLYFE